MSQQHVDSVKNVPQRIVPDNEIDTDPIRARKRDLMTYRDTRNRIESDSDDELQLIRETSVFNLDGGSRIETKPISPAKKPPKAKPVRPSKLKLMKLPSSSRDSQKKTPENGGHVREKSPEIQNR